MSLKPLMGRAESKLAFSRLFRTLSVDCRRAKTSIGWQGGRTTLTVYWNPKLRFWSGFSANRTKTRYWCLFGTSDPTSQKGVSITCEINPPKHGFSRRVAGAFLTDDEGTVYLAHSGNVGGGRKGIGKSGFLRFYQGPIECVQCPDNSDRGYLVIGPVDGDHLPLQVAHFINEVKVFKSGFKGVRGRLPVSSLPVSFKPEFSGQRKSYVIKGEVKSECDHGPLISALAKELEKRKLAYGNDGARDLFVVSKSGKIRILFEAKTSLGTSNIYGAVGQLMLHGAAETKAPSRVLVVPGRPTHKTDAALKKLGIKVLSYELKGNRFTFTKLNEALQ